MPEVGGMIPGGGIAVGASQQLVVSPNGQSAIATSLSVGGATGFGGIGGAQLSISNAPTPSDLGGPFGQLSGSIGGIAGAGAVGGDLNFGKGTTDPNQTIVQLTVTLGIGLLGKRRFFRRLNH